jgi:hypothetical protein
MKRRQLSDLKCCSRDHVTNLALASHRSRHPTRLFPIHSWPHIMAGAQLQTLRQTSILQMPESMNADVALPAADSFIPNGLLGTRLTKQPSSSIPDMVPHSTPVSPTSPFTHNGLFDLARAETGACPMKFIYLWCLNWNRQ